ncbi:MAG TPA: serine hydrolase domain-containing protein [Sphingobacteriaceae bacterium]
MRLICFLLLLSLGAAAQNNSQVDSIMQRHPAFNGVVLVADQGRPVYHKAFGYREYESKVPLQTTDIFELASISKQFTASIIMMLQEQGQLTYDDAVEKYLDIPYKGITIRHLLTHTSGLPDYHEVMDTHWDKSKVAGNADILAYLDRYAPPKLFEPGEKYQYSNTGYVLLASIAEKVTGKDFVKLSRRWIFRPAKMAQTNIRTLKQTKKTSNFALGHIFVNEKSRYVRADSFPSSNYTIWLGNRKGPGRVSSTAADLLKWDRVLYTDERLKQQTLLGEAFCPMVLNNGNVSNYGFGWMLRVDSPFGRVIEHTGDNPGYATQIVRYIDTKKTLILLSNNAYKSGQIIKELESAIHALPEPVEF